MWLSLELSPCRRADGGTQVAVDHAIQRWVVKYSPQLEAFHCRKRCGSAGAWTRHILKWGEWRYLYRAVDKYGETIDFLLTEHRDKEAARFLKKAIRRHGVPRRARLTAVTPMKRRSRVTIRVWDSDHDPPGQIFKQRCGTRSSSSKTRHASHVGVQVVRGCSGYLTG